MPNICASELTAARQSGTRSAPRPPANAPSNGARALTIGVGAWLYRLTRARHERAAVRASARSEHTDARAKCPRCEPPRLPSEGPTLRSSGTQARGAPYARCTAQKKDTEREGFL